MKFKKLLLASLLTTMSFAHAVRDAERSPERQATHSEHNEIKSISFLEDLGNNRPSSDYVDKLSPDNLNELEEVLPNLNQHLGIDGIKNILSTMIEDVNTFYPSSPEMHFPEINDREDEMRDEGASEEEIKVEIDRMYDEFDNELNKKYPVQFCDCSAAELGQRMAYALFFLDAVAQQYWNQLDQKFVHTEFAGRGNLQDLFFY